jgi:predicted ArsR family transcriptional regulator
MVEPRSAGTVSVESRLISTGSRASGPVSHEPSILGRGSTQIVELLEHHTSLGYEQIATLLEERPGEVRTALGRLRERGSVSVVAVGKIERHVTRAASYWRLTDHGLEELRRESEAR